MKNDILLWFAFKLLSLTALISIGAVFFITCLWVLCVEADVVGDKGGNTSCFQLL